MSSLDFLKAILDDKDRVSGLCNGHDDNEESSDDETVEVFGKRYVLIQDVLHISLCRLDK